MSKILNTDTLAILSEASKIDRISVFNSLDEPVINDLFSDLEDLDEIDFDLQYTAEMVVVRDDSLNHRYLVEYQDLARLMESSNTNAKKALQMVCEKNNIKVADTYVVVESTEVIIERALEKKDSIKATKDVEEKCLKEKEMGEGCNSIKEMKKNGIKILKKKAKDVRKKLKLKNKLAKEGCCKEGCKK